MTRAEIIQGDALDVLRSMEAESVDAVVTDPPAGIAFMGRTWDHDKGGRDLWIEWMAEIAAEALRVCKPGAHALVWALPRTSHWTATAWEDAGWEVRDRVAHLFGSGFPKSLSVSRALDTRTDEEVAAGLPLLPEAAAWDGWGTALKPAVEDWWLLRKPLAGTVAQNVARHGTGALNVGACRINPGEEVPGGGRSFGACEGVHEGWRRPSHAEYEAKPGHTKGRWPPNIVTDGSEEVLDAFAKFGESKPQRPREAGFRPDGAHKGLVDFKSGCRATYPVVRGDGGTAARFFPALPYTDDELRFMYCAKASRSERDAGLEHLPLCRAGVGDERPGGSMHERAGDGGPVVGRNSHPTVKPLALMRWLVRLVTPPGGLCLDPFSGSGTTGLACLHEGFRFVGIEREAEYVEISRARLAAFTPVPEQAALAFP